MYWRSKNRDSILQQSVLFSIRDFMKVGGLNIKKKYTMDYELWGKLMLIGNKIKLIDIEIGQFRWYDGQKTSMEMDVTNELVKTADQLLNKSDIALDDKRNIYKRNKKYLRSYKYHQIRSRIGIRRRLNTLLNFQI